jgi:NitT/TauT family transport system permease protein
LPSTLIKERTEVTLNPRQAQSAGVRPGRRGHAHVFPAGTTALGVVLLALVWELAPRAGLVDPHFVSPLHEVLRAWWGMAKDGSMWRQTHASLVRIVAGFGLAIVVGVPLGALTAWYRSVREVTTPVLEIFRNTAPLAILPVFMLVLGIGETSKIAIVCYACLFPILLNTVSGVGNVDQQLLRTARVLGLSPIATFVKVVLPAALPTIFTGVRIAGATSVLVLIAAEMVGATAGLGYFINYAQMNYLIPQMYAAILTTTVLGLVVNYSLVGLERRFSRWRA